MNREPILVPVGEPKNIGTDPSLFYKDFSKTETKRGVASYQWSIFVIRVCSATCKLTNPFTYNSFAQDLWSIHRWLPENIVKL